MSAVKDLVCEKRNIVAARVEFSNLSQYMDENAKKYVARLKGKAETCEFVAISEKAWKCKVSYKESEVLNQFIKGLGNSEWQERLISLGPKLTLQKVVENVSNLEMAKIQQK